MRLCRQNRHKATPQNELPSNGRVSYAGIEIQRVFEPGTADLDDLAAAIRSLLSDDDPDDGVRDLRSEVSRATHVVEVRSEP